MSHPDMETAAPSGIGNGGDFKAAETQNSVSYRQSLGVCRLRRRFRISLELACVVAELAFSAEAAQ